MNQTLLIVLVFLAAYLVNMTYISVLYHRGMTHNAFKPSPLLNWLTRHTGIWITGMDPVTWCCMHRMHHEFSDKDGDPHSPVKYGILGVFKAQYDNYNRTSAAVVAGDPSYVNFISDISYGVHWLKRVNLWILPYALHGLIAIIIGSATGNWLVGLSYWVGMLSHPIQGWMVNSFGHAVGYRNFSTSDCSRNNTIVALTALGEGFQNNHHAYPASAKFACRWFELDIGWIICWLMEKLNLLKINRQLIMPDPARANFDPAQAEVT